MKRNTLKKTIAFVMAFTLVAGTMPANVGGFLTGGTAIVASAEDTPVPYLTWDDVSKTLVEKSGGEATHF